MKILLQRIAHLSCTYPKEVIVYCVVFSGIMMSLLPFVPVDLSFYTLLNEREPLIQRYVEISKEKGLPKQLFLLIEGEEARLSEHEKMLQQRLLKRSEIAWVEDALDLEWMNQAAPWLLQRAQFDLWVDSAQKSLTELQDMAAQNQDLIAKQQDQMQKVQGVRLWAVELSNNPMEEPMGKSSMLSIDKELILMAQETGLQIRSTGLPAIASQDQSKTFDRIQWVTPLSLICVLAILYLVDRRWWVIILVGVPMILAMGATLGLVGTFTGKLTILETVFGIMIFGLGVDFALHLLTRFKEERLHHSLEQAIEYSVVHTGLGVVAGAGTTIGAFAIIALAPDPQALHLGMSGAIGLLICLILMLFFLPACWRLLDAPVAEPVDATNGSSMPPMRSEPLQMGWVTALSHWSCQYPKHSLLGGCGFLLITSIGIAQFHIQTDLTKVFNRDVPALEVNQILEERFQINYNPWILHAQSLEDAHQKMLQLEDIAFLSQSISLSTFLPQDGAQRWQILKKTQEQRQHRYQELMNLYSLNALRMSNHQEQENLLQWLNAHQLLLEATENGPPSIQDIPARIQEQYRRKDGRWLIYAYPKEASLDGKILHEQRLVLEQLDAGVTGLGTAVEGILYVERPWIYQIAVAIFLYLGFYLWLDQRQFKWIFVTLIPVGFGLLGTFGILCWMNLEFSPITLLALPLILGLGIDDGIHVVHRIRENHMISIPQATGLVGQPIVLTTLTSCVSFGALLLTDHPGMESLALVLLVGLPLCLLASLIILPAVIVLLSRSNADAGMDLGVD